MCFNPTRYFHLFMCSFCFFGTSFDEFDPFIFLFGSVKLLRRSRLGLLVRRSLSEFWSEPSSVSLSVAHFLLIWYFFVLLRCSVLYVFFFDLYFLFVCTIRRSIFRCVVLMILSCFCDNVYVPLAYVNCWCVDHFEETKSVGKVG